MQSFYSVNEEEISGQHTELPIENEREGPYEADRRKALP